jgi:hypothetical protein
MTVWNLNMGRVELGAVYHATTLLPQRLLHAKTFFLLSAAYHKIVHWWISVFFLLDMIVCPTCYSSTVAIACLTISIETLLSVMYVLAALLRRVSYHLLWPVKSVVVVAWHLIFGFKL